MATARHLIAQIACSRSDVLPVTAEWSIGIAMAEWSLKPHAVLPETPG